ncbi:MAG TPA: bifunctional [glutamate--ammonia ligase]-adenylyl-L-tyrosine phosphorylase/[glutamate--ammonia-ligase] adenylyltransferase [Candidatus Binatia bacterium]|nr:bifunctional [glutamate--ammonia ligase]-adenylyl-L-tyrosine phosphorylase/[glutamate--ammonia-ligase] adenylyltransferase [Candidatus Binatia bacterium]
MTPEALSRAVADAGAGDARRIAEAAAPLAPWLAGAPADAVVAGLVAAADPAGALHAVARLLEASGVPPPPDRVAGVLRVLGGSPALAAVLYGEGAAWPEVFAPIVEVPRRDVAAHVGALVGAGAAGPVSRAALQAALRRHRRREQVRIGGRDLLGLATVDETMREISALAEGVAEVAVAAARARLEAEWGPAFAGDRPAGFAVLGMGKLGGEELNYSSDVDLVYVYETDGEQQGGRTLAQWFTRLAEEVTRALGEVTEDGLCFRVDLRLRPGGGEGPVAVSLPAALGYYETWGQTWERAAWLKARPIAGDRALAARLLEELVPFVYRRFLDYATIEDLQAMKRRVDASFRDFEAARRDVKLGRGGIREVEFFVQAQQLVHGGKDERLRLRPTLAALAALAGYGYVDTDLAAALADAYRFLRDVEHKVQIAQERQTHVIPADPEEATALARRCGFLADGLGAFWTAHARHTTVVHAAFEALFYGAAEARRRETEPELETLLDQLEHEDEARARLARLGFHDVPAAWRDLRLLRDGPPHAPASARRRQALAALAPALLREIARSAHPDRALHHLATFVSTVGARSSYLHLLLENPGVMRLFVRLFATSEFLSAFFLRHPELLDSLVRADLVRVVRSREELAAELAGRLAAASDLEAELDVLRRFRHEEFLRIGVHDIEGELPPEGISAQLSALAETCLDAALGIASREVLRRAGLALEGPAGGGLAVLGMGKLGSGELDYASDLDLIFIYEPGDAAWWGGRTPHELFTRIAQRAISALQTPTREGMAYRIDTRLRPSGNQGPLVSAREAFEDYHATSAQVWERQALIKARPVAGPPALRERLAVIVERFVYGRGLVPAEVAEIARMRERIARERGEDEAGVVRFKTGRGGLVDVEFLVQMLQLRHGHAHPALRVRSTSAALDALRAEGVLPAAEADALAAGYAFLRALANRARLERDQPVEAVADDPHALAALARRLGYAGEDAAVVAALRADHDRHRAAIRDVYDRRFAEAAG